MRGLVRPGEDADHLPESVERIRGDVAEPASLDAAPARGRATCTNKPARSKRLRSRSASAASARSLTSCSRGVTTISAGWLAGAALAGDPLAGSPAIDAAGTTDPGGTDQRGFARFINSALDIGAVEAGTTVTRLSEDDVVRFRQVAIPLWFEWANKDQDAARLLALHLEVMQNPSVAYLTPDDIQDYELKL